MTAVAKTELILRINGNQGPWPGDFYQDSGQDAALRSDPYRRANTSVSLILRRGDTILLHVLVDCGQGALNSLLDYQRQAGLNRIDALFLTHSHFDHIAGLDWLAALCRRSTVQEQLRPLPLYCSRPCYDETISNRLPWLKDLYTHRPAVSGVCQEIAGLEDAALRVTPLAVCHGPTAPGAMIYVFEHEPPGEVGAKRRIVLAWDMLRLADGVDDALLHGADLLLIDSLTWHPQFAKDDPQAIKNHNTWHGSIEQWLECVPAWKPKRTYWIHYSGFSDSNVHESCPREEWKSINGALPESALRAVTLVEAKRLGLDLRVARHGLIVPYDEPWPETNPR